MPRRRWWSRLSSAHILIFSAGALAFIANLAILRSDDAPPLVAVASADLLPGTVFAPADHATLVPMATDESTLQVLFDADRIETMEGAIVGRRIAAGVPLTGDALSPSSRDDAARLMSLPIDVDHAAGGRIDVGDRVDVVAVQDGVARFVVAGVEVVDVPSGRRESFASSSGSFVVLAVSSDVALALASALDTSELHVLRSTGAPEPDVLSHTPEGP